jgi:hypothetical protein
LTFQFADGTESQEMIDLIDTDEFEFMLEEIMKSVFEFISVIELDFSTGFNVYSAPRKHIRADKKLIAINESDYDTGISYADAPNVMEIKNRSTKYGLLHRAAPYVILQRGGLGDWAQMVELFGMPQRVGKYSIYDTEARKQLQEAFDSQGAAATLIVPKETDIETTVTSGNGGSSLYKDFISTLQELMTVTILSQTMTTMDGSSRAQAGVHKDVEEELNKADLRFVQRILNKKFKPILEARGYKVKDGAFVFPKALKDLTVDELIALSDIIEIPAYYFHEKFGLPQPAAGDVIAKKAQTPQPPNGGTGDPPADPNAPIPVKTHGGASQKKDAKLSDSDKSWFREMFSGFFVDARTLWSRATNLNLADKSTNSTADTNIDKLFEKAIADIYKQYGINPDEMPLVSKPLFDITNSALQRSIDNTFSVEFGKANPEFLNQFKTNAAVFSAFKSHAQGKEIVAQLLDANGNLKSYYDFKKSVLGTSIKADYNENWLKTEYNMAVRSCRMAEKLKGYESTLHLYPNLKFVESTAAEKRPAHLAWVGTILPFGHKWWNTHTPPVDWGCECSVENTDEDVTAVPDDGDGIDPVFAINPAKEANFVNMDEHPYKKYCDEKVRDEIVIIAKDWMWDEVAKAKKTVETRNAVKAWADKKIKPGKQLVIKVDAENIDELTISKTTIKTIVSKGHSNAIERNMAVKNLKGLFKKSEYVGWAEDEIVNGVQKHTDTNYWQYYKTDVGYVCVKFTKDRLYKPYAIVDEADFKKIVGIKRGNPIR